MKERIWYMIYYQDVQLPIFYWGWEEEEEASWIIMVKYFVFCFVFFCFLYHPSALMKRFEDRKPVLTRLRQIDLNWLSSKSPLLPGTGLWPVHRESRRRRYPSKTWDFFGVGCYASFKGWITKDNVPMIFLERSTALVPKGLFSKWRLLARRQENHDPEPLRRAMPSSGVVTNDIWVEIQK